MKTTNAFRRGERAVNLISLLWRSLVAVLGIFALLLVVNSVLLEVPSLKIPTQKGMLYTHKTMSSSSYNFVPCLDSSAHVNTAGPSLSSSYASSSNKTPIEKRLGLRKILTDDELDEFFRITAEVRAFEYGQADMEQLAPLFAPIYHGHRHALGREKAGGFIDVGANVGDLSAMVINAWTCHSKIFYHNSLNENSEGKKLVDKTNGRPTLDHEMAFTYLLEASPTTFELLRRRASASYWEDSGVRLFNMAASNFTGFQRFCFADPASHHSGLSIRLNVGDESSRSVIKGCVQLQTSTIDDLVNSKKGPDAQVFFLKVDVEGADAIVLDGAKELIAANRISFILFENHLVWKDAQEDLGIHPLIYVGDVVKDLAKNGYKCFYMHFYGLIPFPYEGSIEGDRARPVSVCHEGLPLCARHRLYNRQFWSNILCGSKDEEAWLEWLQEAAVSPMTTKESLYDLFPEHLRKKVKAEGV
jgi:FkbM family methyltransferase